MNATTRVEMFERIFELYPDEFRPIIQANRTRILWQVEQVAKNVPAGGKILDLGAGVVPFMPICQLLGYDTYIIDDFQDATYPREVTDRVLAQFESLGVTVVRTNIFDHNAYISDLPSLDMVVTHDSMEHWPNSPKTLFRELWKKLRADGVLWVGVPNCVNLRKRITVPFGVGKWSQMSDWYEQPVFRGHVREPDVDDLRYISRDLGATRIEILGKNWLGYRNPRALVRNLTPLVDRLLQLFPGLCSDIYLFAWK